MNLDGVGDPIAFIDGGKKSGEVIYIDRDDLENGCESIDLKHNKIVPMMNPNKREVWYIAGPAGSGKSTAAASLVINFHKIFPKAPILMFCRTDIDNDPAYAGIPIKQVELDEGLITNPIDIETEVEQGSLVIFDDIGTINDKAVKSAVLALAVDLMECGRKLDLYMIFTSHLVNPNERNFGRTLMNEITNFIFFPKSGSFHQIKHCLSNYFGIENKTIMNMMKIPTRWIAIYKNYPPIMMYEHGAMLMN